MYGQNNLTKIIFESTKDIFVPFCVGGGIRSLEDAYLLLKMGADKITINTAAIEKPKLLTELAKKFGSQCITLSVEAKKVDFKIGLFIKILAGIILEKKLTNGS